MKSDRSDSSKAVQAAQPKLSATQAELLDAIRNSGVICIYMRSMGSYRPKAYYFRSDTHRLCTAAAKALLDKGLVEKFDEKFGGDHRLRAATTSRA